VSAPARPQRRRGLLGPAVFTAAGLVLLIGLGTWQIERKAWKEALIASLERRMAAAAVALPPAERWASLREADDEFTRVVFRAQFENAREALVYAGGSALRPDVSGPGYWVFTPARIASGGLVVVNRGFVPEANRAPATRAAGQLSGPMDIVGALRWPERASWFTPAGEPAHNLWFARDHLAIAAAKGWGAVAPFYVEQEAPPAPGGLPRVGKLVVALPNNHLQYAITWYALAVVLAAVFAAFLRGRWREGTTGEGRGERV
jgi:surfeit locus 1 family protein